MERLPEARLSGGVTAISRIATGYVAEDVPAVFVTGFYEESELVTDVFAMSDGNMQNLAEADPIGAAPRVRDYYVYATDVDSDGITELPKPIPLSTSGDSAGYWIIEWYGLAPDGTRTRKLRTFHNYQSSGGWYLALPDEWENPAIYRGNNVGGVSGYVFARWDQQGKGGELFTLYAFTGERRMELAEADGRFILAEKGETVYSAALGEGRGDLTEDDLRAMFRFIKIDWNTGEM